jgi:hypothetical protein
MQCRHHQSNQCLHRDLTARDLTQSAPADIVPAMFVLSVVYRTSSASIRLPMLNDLRIAVRNLSKLPWFAVAFILTLGSASARTPRSSA